MAQVSIIILTYNSQSYISSCLESLFYFHKKHIEDEKIELIIVDNGSTDNTVEVLFDFFAEKKNKEEMIKIKENITLVLNKKNVGYAAGVNLGAKEAKGNNILLLNPDSKFVNEYLLEIVEDLKGDVAIVGGKMFSGSVVEKSTGKFYDVSNIFWLALGLENFFGLRSSPPIKKFVDYVSGGFLFAQRSIFEKLNGYDENYFMYVEDMDLCYRAKKSGYKVLFNPKFEIEHFKHGSSNRSFAIVNIYTGIFYFFKKNKGEIQYLAVRGILSIKSIIVIILGLLTGNRYYINTYKQTLLL